MSSTKALKYRIRSVSSTKQITKAMELVAASKLRRVQVAARNSRAYSELAYSLLSRVAGSAVVNAHFYFNPNGSAKRKLYVVFSSDRGLAGAFNSNLQHATLNAIRQDKALGIEAEVIVFGRRGASFFGRLSEAKLIAEYEKIADIPEPSVFAPLFGTIDKGIKDGYYSGVVLVYTEFKSALSQSVKILPILPILPITPLNDTGNSPISASVVFEFEPSPEVVLQKAAELYLESQIMQAKLDSAASEYAMRMVSMSSASRNAGDLIDNFQLELNASRQASITQEIAEITGGAAALA